MAFKQRDRIRGGVDLSQTDYLAHWGIRGMKWGVRRYQNEDGTWTAEGKKRRSGDAVGTSKEKPVKPRKRKISELSDEELSKKLNRLRMEEEYIRMAKGRKARKSSRFKKIMADIGEQALKAVATKAIEKAVKNLFKDDEKEPRTKLDVKDVSKLSDKKLTEYNKRYAAEAQAKKYQEEWLGQQAEEKRYRDWLKDHK